MDSDLKNRLIQSIQTNRLVLICGAGISMASPSCVPSAKELARKCFNEYRSKVGTELPAETKEDIERLADHFLNEGSFHSMFVNHLVPWTCFRGEPNPAHLAVADFLLSSLCRWVVTTNFDDLVENAARTLGENDFLVALNGEEARTPRSHQPYLKLHGCCVRDRKATLWSRQQLSEATITEQIESSQEWLVENIKQKDVIFLGFWTDWSYLNEVLNSCVSRVREGVDTSLVVLVDPQPGEDLKEKAPRLYEWAEQEAMIFKHVSSKAEEFLDELRAHFCRSFLSHILDSSCDEFRVIIGSDTPEHRPYDSEQFDTNSLYIMRRDACGVPSHGVLREKWPKPEMKMVGVIIHWLLNEGATLEAPFFDLSGKVVRVIYGYGRSLSGTRREFQGDFCGHHYDFVLCAGAIPDGGAPPDLVRGGQTSTIIRPGESAEWVVARDRESLIDFKQKIEGLR